MAPYRLIWFLFVVCLCDNVLTEVPTGIIPKNSKFHLEHETKLRDYVLQILQHYKQKDPVGIPGAPIPDPLDVPALSHSFSIGTIKMRDMKLYGLKKFRINHVKANVAEMKVEAALTIDMLNVFGNYTLNAWLSSANGPFTVNLTQVYVKAIANLEVGKDGKLEAQEMIMDMSFKEIKMNFENLGMFASMIQGVMNSVGTFVFDSIKPYVLKEVSSNMRRDVNKEVRKLPQQFPNSISPFDQLVSEVRKKIRNQGCDPYKVNDYNNSVGIFDVYMTHTWIYGISTFYRTKDIIIEVKNSTIYALLEAGTQRLLGTSHWEVNFIAGFMKRAGTVKFSVEYVKVRVELSQTMDTRNHPVLDDIQIELGNIQVRFHGLGTADYVIEFAVNVIPNLLRYQIMDALEKPIKLRIQDTLKRVNIETLVKENADKFNGDTALPSCLNS